MFFQNVSSVILLTLAALVTSCITSAAEEVNKVAVVIDDRNAFVRVPKREIREGDHVTVYRQECETKIHQHGGSRADLSHQMKTCEKKLVGEGVAVSALNAGYLKIEFSEGTRVAEGDFVSLR